MFRPWIRVTSGRKKSNRGAERSPPWGPVPVTAGPVTIRKAPDATASRAIVTLV